ncbi:MAG: ATP-dependent DNA helicase [Burkholderiaceae bacterium]|nr:ATP-dependent DNA helicase [Burkholderiaceae bacterium]
MPDPAAAARLDAAVAAAFAPDGPLARSQPGFVVRAGQREMALAVAAAIASASAPARAGAAAAAAGGDGGAPSDAPGGTLVAEAGTGTGKTFAYLVPALLSGGRVLVSTGTRTLQDQLYHRDLPRVREALGVGTTMALLKGRSNYVCRHHLRRNLEEGRFERREDIAVLRRIERFAAISASGDRSEAPGIAEDAPAWARATSTRENCLGQDCPDLADCFVFRARQAAQQADVVVVNHHLFCADLALRDEGVAELLPSADALIFDEAHQLPEIATQFFGRSVSTRQLLDFARDLLRVGLADARDAADWTQPASAIEQGVRVLRLAAGRPGRLDARQLRSHAALREAVADLVGGLALPALDAAAERSRDLARLRLRAQELAQRLQGWLDGLDRDAGATAAGAAGAAGEEPGETPSILWAEVHQSGVTLHETPLSVAETFRRHRESAPRAWIFTSATLAVAGRFDHFVSAMGLEGARTLRWESPFDFARRALLYVPRHCGDPASPGFANRVADAAWPLIEANGGRAFVLCTSLRMVEQQAALLGARIRESGLGLELLVQGQASRLVLIERFRALRSPVLVGSASFWEGVDVVGPQLSLVIIDKLPFAAPDDPILRARIDAMRRAGGDPFRQIQLPAAAMALKQGAGRLIRSESDRGVLAICDERLLDKPYGRSLVASLPPFRLTRDESEAIGFCGDGAPGVSARPATSGDRLPGSPS